MSTVSISASVSTPAVSTRHVRCTQCHGRFELPSGSLSIFPVCPECQHGFAWRDACQLVNDYKALRDGLAPFDVLSPEERAEQLAQLQPDPRPFPRMLELDGDRLIAIAGDAAEEIARRLGSVDPLAGHVSTAADAPDPAERLRVETEAEEFEREQILAREAEEAEPFDAME